ncbi:MAG: RidA family protein [Chloroflexota bacterium]|nr:RidA family protein [Candidatus Limnocylindria bacterium]
MTRKVISPSGMTPSPSPLSAGIVSGNLLFVSGQTAATVEGIEAQTRAVLQRVGAVLEAAGTDHAHVLRCNVYLKDISDFARMNAVYREFFPSDPPARSTISCALADPRILVEIDAVAEVPV